MVVIGIPEKPNGSMNANVGASRRTFPSGPLSTAATTLANSSLTGLTTTFAGKVPRLAMASSRLAKLLASFSTKRKTNSRSARSTHSGW